MLDEHGNEIAQPNPAEQEARSKGWRPLEEFSGDPSKWVPADEFIARSPFYREIGDLKKVLKKREKEIESIVQYTKTQTEAAYKRGLADAHERLDAAVDAGDKEAAREINKEIVQLQAQAPVVAPAADELPEEVEDFQNRNEWFDRDPIMTDVAITLAKRFAADHPRTSLEKRLRMVEDEIAKMFPGKAVPRREAPAAVEGAGAPGAATQSSKGKLSASKLTAEERQVMEQYVRRKVMTEEQYIKSIAEIDPGRFK